MTQEQSEGKDGQDMGRRASMSSPGTPIPTTPSCVHQTWILSKLHPSEVLMKASSHRHD
jgi:hypothetical protein